jgi:hypothetical protein
MTRLGSEGRIWSVQAAMDSISCGPGLRNARLAKDFSSNPWFGGFDEKFLRDFWHRRPGQKGIEATAARACDIRLLEPTRSM